ncbi:response regulator transcription factor [Sulfurimonas sp. C5]|uniref:response regulator transcription factor n=1 Tax=Sulfurimonas sp. C5 TaxID=3036947 RepID=UPI002453CD39|nr:response regulator transcription factor [Sulfurimonas sp. C5]MDH4944472.1 response regulator transcription factor [Sulfurimonas sp. C5]
MKILLLEDEYSLRISIKEFLEDLGYDVECFMDGFEAYSAIHEKSYDLLLLDVNVPSMNGFELLENLRKSNRKIPTIFLTSMTDIRSLKEGYERGCCDYIRKPFDLEELEVRINQACKSFYADNADMIDLGHNALYDMNKEQLFVNDKEVVLRKTENDLLKVLIKHKNAVVSIDMFQDEVWGEYVEPATIRVQLKNLRQKIPEGIIVNRRSVGYIIERQ